VDISKLPGWRAEYVVEAEDHWFPNMAKSLGCKSVSTILSAANHHPSMVVYFDCLYNEKKVLDTFRSLTKKVKLLGPLVKKRPDAPGMWLAMEVKNRDRFIGKLAEADGKVTLYGDPKGDLVRVLVESPLPFNPGDKRKAFHFWAKFGSEIERIPHIRLHSAPKIAEASLDANEFVTWDFALPLSGSLDEKDVKIALKLLSIGYYDPQVKEKSTLESIAKSLQMSKPTLIKRKKRMEALGLNAILSPKIPDEDMKIAARALAPIVKRR